MQHEGAWSVLLSVIGDDPIMQLFLLGMLVLALIEAAGFLTGKRRDLKSAIVTVGVLGTFIGVFVGLIGFDSQHIAESIPALLDGLKFAFLTSIVGMSLAVLLSVIECTLFGGCEVSGSSVGNAVAKLEPLARIEALMERQQQLEQEAEARRQAEAQQLRECVQRGLADTNDALRTALETLSRGATEEVVAALNRVITEFNNNLTAQFGDNFKQLNEAVARLLQWQERYAQHIEISEAHLAKVQASLTESEKAIREIAEVSQGTEALYQRIGEQIDRYDERVSTLTTQLHASLAIGNNAAAAFEKIDQSVGGIVRELEGLTTHIQASLTTQSNALAELTKEIEEKLPGSLGQLEVTLTGLTAMFGRDYEVFLNRLNQLLPR